jgi:hypothetical protein
MGKKFKSSEGLRCCRIMFMHAHADWLGQIAKIRTNYNADHLKKAVMHKLVRFPMSTPSGKLL